MIHYELLCESQHRFDGWFRSSAVFEDQAGAGLVECPVCGSARVHRALMAPSVARPRTAQPAEPSGAAAPPEGGVLPDQMRAALQKLRAEVERSCSYVGDQFAEEARRIHRGDTESRPIYGEASSEQAEDLSQEGIRVARIPWINRADS